MLSSTLGVRFVHTSSGLNRTWPAMTPPAGRQKVTVSSEMLRSISTPEQLETRLGDARLRRRRADCGDRRDRVRPPRLRARLERVSERLCGSVDVRDPQGLPRGGRGGQPDPHLLGADGLGVAVPDRECRHRLLRRHRRSHIGADGRRNAAAGARAVRRHVVSLDHRLRSVGPGPRRRRPVPARPARLRRRRCRTAATTSRTRGRRGH